jgi:hypothetical protein
METLDARRGRLGGGVTASLDASPHSRSHVGLALMMIITTTTGFTTHHRHNPYSRGEVLKKVVFFLLLTFPW